MASGKLSGKTALVTGANSGIGKACVDRFIKEGANVVIADINYELAKELENSIGRTIPYSLNKEIFYK